MPKINVYLPDELAQDVKAASIPVSEVCQRALREEVLKVKAATAIGNDERLKAAAARLRASRDSTMSQREADGHSAGMSWALERATYSELEEIAGLAGQNWIYVNVGGDEDVWPTLGPELDEIEVGNQLNASSLFDRGFVQGAIDAWWAMPNLED